MSASTSSSRFVIDWGTSNFRAYRFGEDGQIAQTHHAPCGILTVEDKNFAAVLHAQIGSWLHPGDQLYFSGMITSRNGWIETPYVDAPARLEDLARHAVHCPGEAGQDYLFLPGVCMRQPTADVMRGEEIQVFGSLREGEQDATVILPGTHSKWVRVQAGILQHFVTHMTGEVFAVMKHHSILGRLMADAPQELDQEAFLKGVAQAKSTPSAGLLHDLFTARSAVLLEQLPARSCQDYLSGLVIGHECVAGLQGTLSAGAVVLVGDAGLCQRYHMALLACDPHLSSRLRMGPAEASVTGFMRLHRAMN